MDLKLRTTGLTWHAVGSEVVVLDLDGAVYLKLNGSARVLWEALADPASLDQLATVLVDEFGIDDERASIDARAFVDELRRRRLLDE